MVYQYRNHSYSVLFLSLVALPNTEVPTVEKGRRGVRAFAFLWCFHRGRKESGHGRKEAAGGESCNVTDLILPYSA
jgi:hypothetical protein